MSGDATFAPSAGGIATTGPVTTLPPHTGPPFTLNGATGAIGG